MADYSSQITALETALALGELSVEVEGRKITYRSVDELRRSLAYFQGKAAQGVATKTTQSFASFTRD